MQEIMHVLKENRYVNIRIDLTQTLPVTIIGGKDLGISKKKRRISMNELILPEDIPTFTGLIDDITAGNSKKLSTHCRLIVGENEYHWFYIDCTFTKDAFLKTPYLSGTVFDVSQYLETDGDDPVISEFRRRSSEKQNTLSAGKNALVDLLDGDYLTRIQMPFKLTSGVFSGIYNEDGELICTPGGADKAFSIKNYKYHISSDIRVRHRTIGSWKICSNKEELLEKSRPLLDTLVETVASIANAFVVLYDEMQNSQSANKALGENVEHQILLNTIYSIILEKDSSTEAIKSVVQLVGEYLKLDRIVIYEENQQNKDLTFSYEWAAAEKNRRGEAIMHNYGDFPQLHEELEFCDNYFSKGTGHELFDKGIASYAAARLSESGVPIGVIFFEAIDGERNWTKQERKVIRSISQIVSTMIIRFKTDIKLRKSNEKLRHLAFFDPVLDIPNRAKLDKDLLHELLGGESGTIIALKITNMRMVNDIFGHSYTDTLLRIVAGYISGMNAEGLSVYRFTGNILIIMLRRFDAEKAKNFIEDFYKRMNTPWENDGNEHYLEAGAGIALYPGNGSVCEDIYRAAMLAMYRSVEFGKNRYAFYSREFEQSSQSNYRMEQLLREDINDNMRGFFLNFQPVVCTGTGKLRFCEAFVHWSNTEIGEIAPTRLVKIAESMGFDIPIDTWVIEKACRFCKDMQERVSPDFTISVNVTARELQTDAITMIIENALKKSGLEAKYLVIEAPEKAILDPFGSCGAVLGRLKKQGISIAIDSFGRDYMALNSLKSSYIDMIKVDQSIFTGANDEFDRILAEALIRLAHSLSIRVCIKKVENEDELNIIRNYGVDLIQGHYFALPVDEEELEKLAIVSP